MNTISEDEFEKLCAEVAADARELLIEELFKRVCQHLGLDPAMQRLDLPGNTSFMLVQTLEDHMSPPFYCAEMMNKHLPPPARN